MGSDISVFVGQCQYDWFVMVSVGESFNPYTGAMVFECLWSYYDIS